LVVIDFISIPQNGLHHVKIIIDHFIMFRINVTSQCLIIHIALLLTIRVIIIVNLVIIQIQFIQIQFIQFIQIQFIQIIQILFIQFQFIQFQFFQIQFFQFIQIRIYHQVIF